MSKTTTPRLLIADDDSALLAAYALFFEPYNYDIRTVDDGEAALRQYHAWHPHAVLLDIQMPGIDGHGVAKAIRSSQSGVSLLLVAATSLTSPSDRAASIQSGFDHHLVKPVKLPELRAILAQHFGSSAFWIPSSSMSGLPSIILAGVLPQEGMLPEGLLSFRLLFSFFPGFPGAERPAPGNLQVLRFTLQLTRRRTCACFLEPLPSHARLAMP